MHPAQSVLSSSKEHTPVFNWFSLHTRHGKQTPVLSLSEYVTPFSHSRQSMILLNGTLVPHFTDSPWPGWHVGQPQIIECVSFITLSISLGRGLCLLPNTPGTILKRSMKQTWEKRGVHLGEPFGSHIFISSEANFFFFYICFYRIIEFIFYWQFTIT